MLTGPQLTALKIDILADPVLNAFPNNDDGNFAIAAAYNLTVVPDYWVWRTSVGKMEVTQQTSVDGTNFNWTGNGFITRSAGEISAWVELFGVTGNVNPSLANVRQAFSDIFSGSGNAAANRTHLLTAARRKAKRAEKLFATGTGSTAVPGLMTFEGNLTPSDVSTSRNL